ncbi:MAG TPA: universal stress protein [Candidatus Sulfotelmatobacter sp.]|nr:universal stress protein [Candidatus Sulfotelmatobacter sp.]
MQVLQTVNKISFKNILFLTDFSEASNAAMAYAAGLARHYNAQLYAGHSCDPVILTETAGTNILQEVEDNSRARLETLAKEAGPKTISLFARGSVASCVPGWINEHGIDLIIMGTHGRRGLQHLLLGSAAEAIVRSANCPVLTVGPHVTVRPYRDFSVESILFPTDLGAHAEFGAQYALSVAQENCASVTFMHVISQEEAFQRGRHALVETTYQKLIKIPPPDAKEWCKPDFVVEVGDTVKELLAFAEAERPDLIVLGLPAGKKFNGTFRSSVTYNVIAGAPCPVLTVRDVKDN